MFSFLRPHFKPHFKKTLKAIIFILAVTYAIFVMYCLESCGHYVYDSRSSFSADSLSVKNLRVDKSNSFDSQLQTK